MIFVLQAFHETSPNMSSYADALAQWRGEREKYVKAQVRRNVVALVKGFDTPQGLEILRAEAAHRDGTEEDAREILVRNVERLTKKKASKDFAKRRPPPKKPPRRTNGRKKKRFYSDRIVSSDDLKLARFAFYGALVFLPWISILLPFYFLPILRRGQWMSQVVTYNVAPPKLSARGRQDYQQFVYVFCFPPALACIRSSFPASRPFGDLTGRRHVYNDGDTRCVGRNVCCMTCLASPHDVALISPCSVCTRCVCMCVVRACVRACRHYINSSLIAGSVYTVLFVVWIAIFQGNITSVSPPAWALSLIVGSVDPTW